ncbi:MAG: LysM peptidoglycan-binding domain-containing protein [Muribaculaceae bacterium]|nr:LysM peptidoglycan-binding domain-containing protein [Muribaculaceae bacterium]
MWKKIIVTIASIMIGSVGALADIVHTVSRGETIESIAEKYRITTEKLLEVNVDASSLFYIGQKLQIPIEQKDDDNLLEFSQAKIQYNMISTAEQGLADDAKRHFENKEWGKAVKTYSKLIKSYPKSLYYYNRGLSHFNNNKNRQAANDFKKALSMEDCTPNMLKNGPALLAEAQKRHKEWKDRQLNMIGSAILSVAAVGLSTWAAVESTKAESSNKQYQNTESSSSSYESNTSSANDKSENITPNSKKKQKCGFCGGKGTIIDYTASFDNPDKWCDECGKKVVSGHYHRTCTHCHGTGEH